MTLGHKICNISISCLLSQPFIDHDIFSTHIFSNGSKKVNFRPVNTDRGAHLPFEANWARLIFRRVGFATPPPQGACYFPSIAGTHLYTWDKRSNNVKCLSQGHNMLTVTGFEPITFCL